MPMRNPIRDLLATKSVTRKLVIVAIAAQLLVLAYMAGKREYIQATGEQIFLRSAPIDPRDPFRGDFVRLRYDINTVHKNSYRGTTAFEDMPERTVLYAVLKPGTQDVVAFDYLTDRKPDDGIFIKGRLDRIWRFSWLWGSSRARQEHEANVRYGIEQYFVQQGKGKEMEDKLGERNTLQIPVEMRISLGRDGTAVITGHRWSQLGIHLEFIRSTLRGNIDEPVLSPIVKIMLQNVSEDALTLLMPADNCAFSLIRREGKTYEEHADQGCDAAAAKDVKPVLLNPGDNYSVELDFGEPRWHILHRGKRIEMAALGAGERFRVAMSFPPLDGTANKTNDAPVWSGEMITPMFSVFGGID